MEFEAIAHQHTIRLPESVPEGASLRVLLLSRHPLVRGADHNLKNLLATVTAGLSDADLSRSTALESGAAK
jgi:hypothetical protein